MSVVEDAINGEEAGEAEKLFVDAIRPKEPEVKDEWIDGRYKFFRVKDKAPEKLGDRTPLDVKLSELKAVGVHVLDFRRQHADWIIQTMAPREEAT